MDNYFKNQMTQRAKTSLRLSHNKLDDDLIKPLIETALLDLDISGANLSKPLYPLVERAVVHYVHINFPMGADEKEISRHERAYQSLKNQLTLVSRKGKERDRIVQRSNRTYKNRTKTQ